MVLSDPLLTVCIVTGEPCGPRPRPYFPFVPLSNGPSLDNGERVAVESCFIIFEDIEVKEQYKSDLS